MKRICAIVLVLLLLAALELPVMAAENEFAPSIGYKGGPEIDKAEMDEEEVTPCLVITSIPQAQKKETDITQNERDLLLEVYEKLSKNEMELPLKNDDYVVRELIDISWRNSDCVEQDDHNHKKWLSQDNTFLKVTFDTKIPQNMDVVVLVYIDDQWIAVTDVTRNSNDSITCVFEDICPVAICVREITAPPAQTGDPIGQMLWLWIVLMVVSLGTMTVLVMNRRKFMR